MAKMSQAKINKSLEALKADIAAAVESATTMKAKVQHALEACASHWRLTGSNAGLKDIVNAFIGDMKQGVNAKAIVAWCEKHLAMIPNADETGLVFIAGGNPSDAKAAAEKWYTLKVQNPFAFDLNEAIIALVKKAEKAEKALAEDANAAVKIENDHLIALKAIAAKVSENAKAKETA